MGQSACIYLDKPSGKREAVQVLTSASLRFGGGQTPVIDTSKSVNSILLRDGIATGICRKYNVGACSGICASGRAHVCFYCLKPHPQGDCNTLARECQEIFNEQAAASRRLGLKRVG